MKKEQFEELVESIKEAGKIHRGEMKASREFVFDPQDVRVFTPMSPRRAKAANRHFSPLIYNCEK